MTMDCGAGDVGNDTLGQVFPLTCCPVDQRPHPVVSQNCWEAASSRRFWMFTTSQVFLFPVSLSVPLCFLLPSSLSSWGA